MILAVMVAAWTLLRISIAVSRLSFPGFGAAGFSPAASSPAALGPSFGGSSGNPGARSRKVKRPERAKVTSARKPAGGAPVGTRPEIIRGILTKRASGVNPDPDDPYFRQFPGEFRTELHDRLTTPFYGLVFALLPLLFIGQAESPRESRTASIAVVVGIIMIISAIGIVLPNFAEGSIAAVILMYALPLGAAAITVALVLAGAQLRPPERVIAFGEALFGRVSGLLRAGTMAGGTG